MRRHVPASPVRPMLGPFGAARGLAIVLIAGSAIKLAGCSAGQPRAAGPSTAPLPDRVSPSLDRRAAAAPLPPGLAADQIGPVAADDGRARLSLADARASLRAELIDDAQPAGESPPPHGGPADATDDDAMRATQLYVAGRRKRMDGQNAAAVADLREAARLSPASVEVWHELGQAQLGAGNRYAARLAFRRLLSLSENDPRAIRPLAAMAVESRDWALAARLLARMDQAENAAADPAEPFLTAADFGQALLKLGYLSAAAESLRSAIDLPERFTQPTLRQQELGQLYRSRGDLWRDVGDAEARLGRFDQAADAYNRATQLPTLNPAALLPRRVFAALRQGRSEVAGAVIADHLVETRGRVEPRVLALIEYTASNITDPLALARAIDLAASRLRPEDTRAARSAITRAKAVSLPPADAASLLAEAVRAGPGDDALFRELFRLRLGGGDEAGTATMLREAIDQAAAVPLEEARITQAMLSLEPNAAGLLGAMDRLPAEAQAQPAAALLRGRLLALAGRLGEAESTLAALSGPPELTAAGSVLRAGVLSSLGRVREADALLDALDASTPRTAWLRAAALADRGDFERALEGLQPLLSTLPDSDPLKIESLIAAGRLSARLGRPSDAAASFDRALVLDAFRDDAYAGLIQLHAPNGPMPDEAKLVRVIRALNDANPSSRVLRWVRAQDFAARGQLDLAERDLLDLIDDSPGEQAFVDALVRLWTRAGSFERAEAWLRQKLKDVPATAPAAATFIGPLADVLVAAKRYADAAEALAGRLAAVPGDANASRRLETVYREHLGRVADADTLTRKRLDQAPRNAVTLLERAQMEGRAGRPDLAAAAIVAAAEVGRGLTKDQLEWVNGYLVRMMNASIRRLVRTDAGRGGDDTTEESPPPADALSAAQQIADRIPDVSDAVHLGTLVLRARLTTPMDALLRRADLVAAVRPSLRDAAYVTLIEDFAAGRSAWAGEPDLAQTRRPRPSQFSDALAVAKHATARVASPSGVLRAWHVQLALAAADLEEAAGALALADRSGGLADMLRAMTDGRALFTIAADPSSAAYELGQEFFSADRPQEYELLLRAGLRLNPNHPDCNNSLGYTILETLDPARLDEAAGLIETAFEHDQPPRAHITDSMGWLRYRQGIIHDDVDPASGKARRGAVSILSDALRLAEGQGTFIVPELADHLGDAMWAAGRRDEAIRLWRKAGALGEEIRRNQERIRRQNPAAAERPLGRFVVTMIEHADAAREKVRAAEAGQEPGVARILAPVNRPVGPQAAPIPGAAGDPAAPHPPPPPPPPPPAQPVEPVSPGA
ncbi:MAG: hypothetical protein IBJ11_01475 [Phycisphaerales bacterium]|nr:hypothetical protein [Phycisphaerales bacterium]